MATTYYDYEVDPFDSDEPTYLHFQTSYYGGSDDDFTVPSSANFPNSKTGLTPTRYFLKTPYIIDVSDLSSSRPISLRDTTLSVDLSRVSGVPGSGEYRIASSNSSRRYIIELNSAQSGNTIAYDLYALGTVITGEGFNDIEKTGTITTAGAITTASTITASGNITGDKFTCSNTSELDIYFTGSNIYMGAGTRSGDLINIFIGADAGDGKEGGRNIGIGYGSLSTSGYGRYNTAVGYNTLSNHTTGDYNTVMGDNAGTGITTSDENTIIGSRAGTSTCDGDNNTLLGYNAEVSSSTVDDEITLGNSSISSLRCNVTSITSLSDKRDKAEIVSIKSSLDFVNDLIPSTWKWNKREWYDNNDNSDESKKEDNLSHGFIAQDLQNAQKKHGMEWLNLVYESNPDKLEVSPSNLITVLVKAIQELSAEIETLKRNK